MNADISAGQTAVQAVLANPDNSTIASKIDVVTLTQLLAVASTTNINKSDPLEVARVFGKATAGIKRMFHDPLPKPVEQ
jgi:hypothetical protein